MNPDQLVTKVKYWAVTKPKSLWKVQTVIKNYHLARLMPRWQKNANGLLLPKFTSGFSISWLN